MLLVSIPLYPEHGMSVGEQGAKDFSTLYSLTELMEKPNPASRGHHSVFI